MTLVACLVREPASAAAPGGLVAVARACSPRVVPWGETAVVFDASGLDRAIGPPARIAAEVIALARRQGLATRLALASQTTSAWLLAHTQPGVTLVPAGEEAAMLAGLPLETLTVMGAGPGAPTGLRFTPDLDCLAILRRWGLVTLGDLARVSPSDLGARLGPDGVRLQLVAAGRDECPWAPADEVVRFQDRCELDWPIDGLEPLAFVIARLCEALEDRLARADRGAVALTTRLRLVTKTAHERTLHVPAPMRDARVLRTLILLDLESHPPAAAVDVIELDLEVAPGRIVTGTLFDRSVPSPEDVATLVARLGALMGETRIGAPVLLDTFDERVRAHVAFTVPDRPPLGRPVAQSGAPGPALRRLPLPVAAQVIVEHGRPVRVTAAARPIGGGPVTQCAGPWRSSGAWWTFDRSAWDRDEWDIELPSGLYRLGRDRATGAWSIDGIVD